MPKRPGAPQRLAPDKREKFDHASKMLAKFSEKIDDAQTELNQILSDGEITPEEQPRYDELSELVTGWQSILDRLFPDEPETGTETEAEKI